MISRCPILPVLLLLVVSFTSCRHRERHLFRIVQDGLVGYMDTAGKVVIPLVYKDGGDFSEGLAAVRVNGYYGYIDVDGHIAIKAQYDFAEAFTNGIARVFVDGKPLFIDSYGKSVLGDSYRDVAWISTTRAIVTTTSRKDGVMNMITRSLFIDTVYEGIAYECEVFRALSGDTTLHGSPCVMDTLGNVIVPAGKYAYVDAFVDGIAEVHLHDPGAVGAIDTKGRLLFSRRMEDTCSIVSPFKSGVAQVILTKYWLPKPTMKDYMRPSSEFVRRNYYGYVDIYGHAIMNDSVTAFNTEFSCGRAFVESPADGRYHVIDTRMRTIGRHTFKLRRDFENGYATVMNDDDAWGIIDTNGEYVVQPEYGHIEHVTDKYFFHAEIEGAPLGLKTLKGRSLIDRMIWRYDSRGFFNGLLAALVHGQLTYFDTAGKIVWQQHDNRNVLKDLDVDHQLEGYFEAIAYVTQRFGRPKDVLADSTLSDEDRREYNLPRAFGKRVFDTGAFSLVISTGEPDTFSGVYRGYHVYLANATNDTITVNVQSNRLAMKVQAKDKKGTWRDIEYLRSSFCGNSYYNFFLPPAFYWQFVMPRYTGALKTKIRIVLEYGDTDTPKKRNLLYSNEVEASVNPAQFWRVQEYNPTNLMGQYAF